MKNYTQYDPEKGSEQERKEFYEELKRAFANDTIAQIRAGIPKDGLTFRAWQYALQGACIGGKIDNIATALDFEGWVKKMSEVLSKEGFYDLEGTIMQHFIAKNDLKDPEVLKALELMLDKGFHVNNVVYPDDGGTLYSIAMVQSNIPMLNLLEKKGASLVSSVKGAEDLTEQECQSLTAEQKRQYGIGTGNPIYMALKNGDVQVLDWLIQRRQQWQDKQYLFGNIANQMLELLHERSESAVRLSVMRKLSEYIDWQWQKEQTLNNLEKISQNPSTVNHLYARCILQGAKVHTFNTAKQLSERQDQVEPLNMPPVKVQRFWSRWFSKSSSDAPSAWSKGQKANGFASLMDQHAYQIDEHKVIRVLKEQSTEQVLETLAHWEQKGQYADCALLLWSAVCASSVGYFNTQKGSNLLAQKSQDPERLQLIKQALDRVDVRVIKQPLAPLMGMSLMHACMILDEVSLVHQMFKKDTSVLVLDEQQQHHVSMGSCAFLAGSSRCMEWIYNHMSDSMLEESVSKEQGALVARKHLVHVLVQLSFKAPYHVSDENDQQYQWRMQIQKTLEKVLEQYPWTVRYINEEGLSVSELVQDFGKKIDDKLIKVVDDQMQESLKGWYKQLSTWVHKAYMNMHVQEHLLQMESPSSGGSAQQTVSGVLNEVQREVQKEDEQRVVDEPPHKSSVFRKKVL